MVRLYPESLGPSRVTSRRRLCREDLSTLGWAAMLPIADMSTVAEVTAAAGTLLAVVVALYTQPFREWRERPRLSLSLGSNKTGIGLGNAVADEARSVGLRVAAARRRRTAHDVEIFVTADWFYPEQETAHRFIDHEPLQWIGGSRTDQPTVLSLAPGVSREVSLLQVGRPLDLYEAIGLSRPTPHQIEGQERETGSFAVVDVSNVGTFSPFLHNHLVYRFRIDVTGRDVDTVSYEILVRVGQRWEGPAEPSGGAALAQATQGVEIILNWSPLQKVSGDGDVPEAGKLWIGSPPFK